MLVSVFKAASTTGSKAAPRQKEAQGSNSAALKSVTVAVTTSG